MHIRLQLVVSIAKEGRSSKGSFESAKHQGDSSSALLARSCSKIYYAHVCVPPTALLVDCACDTHRRCCFKIVCKLLSGLDSIYIPVWVCLSFVFHQLVFHHRQCCSCARDDNKPYCLALLVEYTLLSGCTLHLNIIIAEWFKLLIWDIVVGRVSNAPYCSGFTSARDKALGAWIVPLD